MKKLSLYVLFVIVYSQTTAQNEVHMVTKTIEKELDYSSGDELEIRAEKAAISITTWEKRYISLEIKLISKHKKKEVAKSELELLKYQVTKVENKHLVSNFFEANDKFVRVKGNLQAEFILKIPDGCDIVLTNHYGKLSVSNLSSDMNAILKFVDFQIIGGTGSLNIQSSFGDLYLKGFRGSLKAKLERSNLEVLSFNGIANLEANYGAGDIEGGRFQELAVHGKRTKINFTTSNLESYNYDVKTTFSAIRVPASMGTHLILDKEYQKLSKDFNAKNSKVKLHTTYGSVNLKQILSASTK